MQFGMFYEIQVPKPWHENKEFDTYSAGARVDRTLR